MEMIEALAKCRVALTEIQGANRYVAYGDGLPVINPAPLKDAVNLAAVAAARVHQAAHRLSSRADARQSRIAPALVD